MKRLEELITIIESSDTAINYLILSGFSTVLMNLQSGKPEQELLSLLRDNPKNQNRVQERIEALIPSYEAGYLHPHDIPITIYLYALEQVGNIDALNEVIHAMPQATGFFWARKMALKIYQEKLQNLPQKP